MWGKGGGENKDVFYSSRRRADILYHFNPKSIIYFLIKRKIYIYIFKSFVVVVIF